MNIDQAIISNRVEQMSQLQKKSNLSSDDKKLMETCKEFESMFIKQMLDSMKKTVNKSGLIKENMGEKIFDDMLYDEYSKKMASSSRFGIAETMYKQLSVAKYH